MVKKEFVQIHKLVSCIKCLVPHLEFQYLLNVKDVNQKTENKIEWNMPFASTLKYFIEVLKYFMDIDLKLVFLIFFFMLDSERSWKDFCMHQQCVVSLKKFVPFPFPLAM